MDRAVLGDMANALMSSGLLTWTEVRIKNSDYENQTIGILLWAYINNEMVKLSLPENNRSMLASQYQLYLPTENQLLEEMRKELYNAENEIS